MYVPSQASQTQEASAGRGTRANPPMKEPVRKLTTSISIQLLTSFYPDQQERGLRPPWAGDGRISGLTPDQRHHGSVQVVSSTNGDLNIDDPGAGTSNTPLPGVVDVDVVSETKYVIHILSYVPHTDSYIVYFLQMLLLLSKEEEKANQESDSKIGGVKEKRSRR